MMIVVCSILSIVDELASEDNKPPFFPLSREEPDKALKPLIGICFSNTYF